MTARFEAEIAFRSNICAKDTPNGLRKGLPHMVSWQGLVQAVAL